MKKGISGADDATIVFAFLALKPGETTLIFSQIMQGELQKTTRFIIKVK